MELLQQYFARPLEAMGGMRPLDETAVYSVRRALKRARAGLRLVRDVIGKDAYVEENRRLRDAARPLAPARDADVAIETVNGLLGRRRMRAHAAALRDLRERLLAERDGARTALEGPLVEDIEAAIRTTGVRVASWRMPRDPWPVLSVGVERIYRRGRKALATARAETSDETLHELRKQVKYLGASMEILGLTKLAARAERIAKRLGTDHDLALLRPRMGPADFRLALAISARRRKLQRKALKRARELYACKPGKFISLLA